MKVLLVQCYLGGNEPVVYPIGLACVASGLGDHEVKVFDSNVSANPLDELKEIIESFAPDFVGFSLRNIDSTNKRKVVYYYRFLAEFITAVKQVSSTPIAVGGAGFSMYAEQIMTEEPRIDYGLYLEGETTLGKLLKSLDSPDSIPSVYYRKEGAVLFTGPGTPPDLDRLPPPARGAIALDKYLETRDAIGIETKRGCALKCVYCIYGFLNGKTYRLKDPAKVVDEIETLIEGGVDRFTFVDSVFNIPKEHATAVCEEIIKRGVTIKWSAWFNEKGFTREFADLMVKAGCDNFVLSPDGFSDETLKALGKNFTREDIFRVYAILKEIKGIEISYNFFKNPPAQTLSNFLAMMIFCVKAKRELGGEIHFEFNSIRVEPHTKMYKIALDEGLIEEGADLLKPVYYTNRKTKYIEKLFNLLLALKGK